MEEGVVVGGGYFGWILEEGVLSEEREKVLVGFLGPSGLSLLARTCRFLFRAVFTSAKPLWSLVSLPEPSEVVVKFFIDISPVEDGQKENVTSVPLSQVKSEYQKNQLLKYWIRTVSNAHAVREKQIEQSKKDDPLLGSDKLPIKAVLKGGFSFYVGKADKPLAKVNDLSQVPKWLEGIYGLLKSSDKAVTVPSEEGNVSLARVGRGGNMLSVTAKGGKGDKELFDFGAFSEALRKISKDYLRVVGSCRTKLSKTHNAPQLPAFPEIQKFISGVLSHDNLNTVLRNIKNDLRKGAIPHSTLPDYFKRKLKEKALRNEQASSENGSIVNFLLSNLPPSLEEAKKARDALDRKLKQQIENEVEERRVAREERIQKEREARREAFEAEKAKKEGKKPKEVEKDKEKEKKEKYKVVKEVGADGFETKVQVDADGKKVKVAKAKVETSSEKPVKVKVPESVSASQNPFKPALLAGDSGIEIKEAKPVKAAQKPEEPKKKTEEPKKETKKETKPAEQKKKTDESKKEVTEVATETAPKPKADKKVKTKADNKEGKKDKDAKKDKKAKAKKPKSEEDQGSGRLVAKNQPSITQAAWFTPALGVFLLVLAVSALYTLFLS
eukprot:TRINITY_DN1422_c0_g1_i1.p1 TRINITY_DN1422_c0_g1~~TRINITY_DN1422_c0_g1_i1.p1  ORF type:complete len:703 (-),score=206.52 TRINITY_DN1422_c0_g1_i1:37-1872(-)